MDKEMKKNLNTCHILLKEVDKNPMFEKFLKEIQDFEAPIIAVKSL